MSVAAERLLAEIAGLLDRLYSEAVGSLEAALDEERGVEEVARHCREAERLRRLILDKSIELLARFQPVARELRRTTAYMDASYDLFRVTRYALETSRLVARTRRGCRLEAAREALVKAREMLGLAYEALRREDPEEARRVVVLDEEVDRMYLHLLDKLQVEESMTRCEVVELLIVRHMERVADHAVYIASAAHYVATGRRLGED